MTYNFTYAANESEMLDLIRAAQLEGKTVEVGINSDDMSLTFQPRFFVYGKISEVITVLRFHAMEEDVIFLRRTQARREADRIKALALAPVGPEHPTATIQNEIITKATETLSHTESAVYLIRKYVEDTTQNGMNAREIDESTRHFRGQLEHYIDEIALLVNFIKDADAAYINGFATVHDYRMDELPIKA